MTTVASSARVRRQAWIAWTAVAVIWGTTYLGIKICLETIPPFLMGGLRYLTAGVLLALVLVVRGKALPAWSEWSRIALLGFFMVFMGNGGVVWGEQFIPSGLTAVLIGTSPFWMVGFDALLPDGRKLHLREVIGLLIGFSGIVILVWPDISAGGVSARGMIFGAIAVQLACFGWAIGSSYTRRHVMPHDVLGSAAIQMFSGGAFMFIAGSLLGEWSAISFNVRTASAFAYLTIVGAVVAFAAYSYALKHLDVATVSLYTYVNPVIAVILGTLLLGEPFHMRMVVAAIVIVVGILIVRPARKT